MPSVLCLNDQGGSIMECSENISGTLRTQEHGHQPLVLSEGPDLYENHGIDARYRGPLSVAPTLPARAGTGGNNLSLVAQTKPASSRRVFARPRSDAFRETDTAGTQSARQSKDATDVVLEQPFLIRRLVDSLCRVPDPPHYIGASAWFSGLFLAGVAIALWTFFWYCLC